MYQKLQPPHQYTEMYLQCMKLCVCEMKACSSIPYGALVPEGTVRGLDRFEVFSIDCKPHKLH